MSKNRNMYCKNCGKQIKTNKKFCKYCGFVVNKKRGRKRRFIWKIPLSLLLILILGIICFFLFSNSNDEAPKDATIRNEDLSSMLSELNPNIEPVGYFGNPEFFDSDDISVDEWQSYIQYYETEKTVYSSDKLNFQFPNQNEIFSSVVKIICEDSDNFYFGSGTNFNGSGYVLTNMHVVNDAVDECIVGFADPNSGLIKEAYWASPIIDKDNITGHDLAYLSIESPVFDKDYKLYGYYNKIENGLFPYFRIENDCYEKSIQLGSTLFVIGYPVLSGGALTITNGLVSSLYSQDGYIITSAKIVSGNSGGVAVDGQGCYVGVPTAVYYEEGEEYFGEIIDAEFVNEFDEAIKDDLEEYYKTL